MEGPISWLQARFPRRVVDSVPGFGTAAAIGRAARDGVMVDIEGQPMFFRDLPNEEGQKTITMKHGHPQGRVFTTEEIEAVNQAAETNRELNDATLRSMQGLYDDHDPRLLAGMALVGALGGGSLALLSRPGVPPQQMIEQGAS